MLEEVWARNHGVWKAIVKSMLYDHSAVDDVLQDALTQVIKSKRHFPNEAEACQYIRRAVVNTTIEYYRRLRRQNTEARMKYVTRHRVSPDTPLAIMMREEQEQADASLLRAVLDAKQRLSSLHQEAVDLAFGRDRKLKEICRERGIPYSTLHSRVLNAVDQIRKELKTRGFYTRLEEVEHP
jgi:RNA polymerase sigma factor (sigma-70 family)